MKIYSVIHVLLSGNSQTEIAKDIIKLRFANRNDETEKWGYFFEAVHNPEK
jgi:hypothetical protein